jgi:hypothetical protein
MTDPSNIIRDAIFSQIKGQLYFNSVEWKPFKAVKKGTEIGYVQINSPSLVGDRIKGKMVATGAITIEVVGGGAYNQVNYEAADDVGSQVCDLLDGKVPVWSGYSFGPIRWSNIQTLEEFTETEVIIRKQITFEFWIQQL